MDAFLTAANKNKDKIIGWRRLFHQAPELSWQEFTTAKSIKAALSEMAIAIEPAFAEPAVVGLIRGAQEGKTVALRADIDALPVLEDPTHAYPSKNEGVMHACGHDSHIAMVLGAALLLQEERAAFAGQIKLIFQPSEEAPPSGAEKLVRDGVLENPRVDAILAHHVQSSVPVGKLEVAPGPFKAAADLFRLTIRGRSGHAAHPHLSVDAVVIAAEVIMAFQTIVSRKISPLAPAVLSVSAIKGGDRFNILAGEVECLGTIRCIDSRARAEIHRQMRGICQRICEMNDAQFDLVIDNSYPLLDNDAALVKKVSQAARSVLGADNVSENALPSMGSEDFAYYQQQVPGVMTSLGVGNAAKGYIAPLHSGKFELDEDALVLGSAIMARFAYDYLKG